MEPRVFVPPAPREYECCFLRERRVDQYGYPKNFRYAKTSSTPPRYLHLHLETGAFGRRMLLLVLGYQPGQGRGTARRAQRDSPRGRHDHHPQADLCKQPHREVRSLYAMVRRRVVPHALLVIWSLVCTATLYSVAWSRPKCRTNHPPPPTSDLGTPRV